MGAKSEGNRAFALYRGCMWFLGVWPLEEGNPFKTARYVFAATTMASFVLHTTVEIYLSNVPISDMADVCLFFASVFNALIKHTFLHIHRKRLAENLKVYLDDWDSVSDEKMLKIMRHHAKVYNYQFIVFSSVGYIGTTAFLLKTVQLNLEGARQPAEDEFEYNLVCQASFLSREFVARHYKLLMAIQYLQCMYTCTSGAGTDCFFFGLVLHLSAQLEILKLRWYELEASGWNGPASRLKLTGLIARHQTLLRLGDNLEASFNFILLMQLMASVILICMSGVGVLVGLKEEDQTRVGVSLNCISFMITESLIFGYAGEYLIEHSEGLGQAVYAVGWYAADPHSRRDVLFAICRAQRPLRLTAGKFFWVTRNAILQLLKTTASYLSVMRLTIELSYQDEQL